MAASCPPRRRAESPPIDNSGGAYTEPDPFGTGTKLVRITGFYLGFFVFGEADPKIFGAKQRREKMF